MGVLGGLDRAVSGADLVYDLCLANLQTPAQSPNRVRCKIEPRRLVTGIASHRRSVFRIRCVRTGWRSFRSGKPASWTMDVATAARLPSFRKRVSEISLALIFHKQCS